MDESIAFYRSTREQHEDQLRRSANSSRDGSVASTPNPRHHLLVPSQAHSHGAHRFTNNMAPPSLPVNRPSSLDGLDMSKSTLDVPKYALRESKFLRRDEYGMTPAERRQYRLDHGLAVTPSVMSPPQSTTQTLKAAAAKASSMIDNVNGGEASDGESDEQARTADRDQFYEIDDNDNEQVESEGFEEGSSAEERGQESAEEDQEEDEDVDEEEEDYYDEDEENDDYAGQQVPDHLQGGNSLEDAIEL